ncbi:hypothetical protein GCM10023318_60220 [Nocardia callitridis]|uniref:Uncharacterized protein n=1 Tax=Nocardia callitridis TaxID=648753 RepID=A0ABP9L102_9NOCA
MRRPIGRLAAIELPVTEHPDGVDVDIGGSRLIVAEGAEFSGVHHLAFGISGKASGSAAGITAQRRATTSVADRFTEPLLFRFAKACDLSPNVGTGCRDRPG